MANARNIVIRDFQSHKPITSNRGADFEIAV